jgi:predicted nucleic acid-binding protein
VAVSVFLDTSVLLAGLIDFGPQSLPAQSILSAVAERQLARPSTAWHCCLEFFSVATRLPPEFRLSPAEADRLLSEEIFSRFDVLELPARDRAAMLHSATQDGIAGGRIYDAHIAAIARAANATVIVTDNRRHFLAALRHGIRVETPAEFFAANRPKKG